MQVQEGCAETMIHFGDSKYANAAETNSTLNLCFPDANILNIFIAPLQIPLVYNQHLNLRRSCQNWI